MLYIFVSSKMFFCSQKILTRSNVSKSLILLQNLVIWTRLAPKRQHLYFTRYALNIFWDWWKLLQGHLIESGISGYKQGISLCPSLEQVLDIFMYACHWYLLQLTTHFDNFFESLLAASCSLMTKSSLILEKNLLHQNSTSLPKSRYKNTALTICFLS